MTHQEPKNNKEEPNKDDSSIQPEPETLHTTDPQDNMEGPISSLIHGTGESFDTDKTPKQADKEKEEKM